METPPHDSPKDQEVFRHIDETLAEYDHQRVIEESIWNDLQELVNAGDLNIETANHRYLDWLNRKRAGHDTL